MLEIYHNNVPDVRKSDVDKKTLSKTIMDNLEENIIPFIQNNPQVEFMLYFPPYSIVSWGIMENCVKEIECMKLIIERLLVYPNVSIYFYQGEQKIITDLDHYMDTIHFDTVVANKIIDYMADDTNKLTSENYESGLDEFGEVVMKFDYSSLAE